MKPYAAHPQESKGRFHATRKDANRDDFQRDRDRIVHSKAFRRLAHKTQVFVYYEGDHYRNRLTHSLEVSQITRSCARMLGVNEDLAELTALSHDLGHPPFGHAGEWALDEKMLKFGGFDHNAQSLRIVTFLENRYPLHTGLNLTIESLEGILKHNGPICGDIPQAITFFKDHQKLDLHLHAGMEAQIAAICDDIAYNAHDIDDGLRADMFCLDQVSSLEFCADIIKSIKNDFTNIAPYPLKHEFIRRLITYFVQDMIQTTQKKIDKASPKSYDDVRNIGETMVVFSKKGMEHNRQLKEFLLNNMYRHPMVNRMSLKAKRVIHDLCDIYLAQPDILPLYVHPNIALQSPKQRALIITDFIAGMTDKFALEEHRKLFDLRYQDL